MGFASRFRGIVVGGLVLTTVSAATAKYSGGTGEPNDPYQVATAADLIALGETPEDYGKHFILTADIDLDPSLPGRKVFDKAVIAPDADQTNDGIQGVPFAGVLDGNRHTIAHLTIKGGSGLGLLGKLGYGAEVEDLGLVDVNIVGSGGDVGGLVGSNGGSVTQCCSSGIVSGSEHVGGLVGYNGWIVTHCRSSGVVSGSEGVGGLVGENLNHVFGSCSIGRVNGGLYVGGLVGYNAHNVTVCYSACAVHGDRSGGGVVGWDVGGLVGWNTGHVTHGYSAGAVTSAGEHVGGLVGDNEGPVTHCYSTGAVVGSRKEVGGLVGAASSGNAVVSQCFWDIETTGRANSAGGTGLTTADMQDPQTYLDAGWDWVGRIEDGTSEIWQMPEGHGYPALAILSGRTPLQLQGRGIPGDPYLISSALELGAMCYYSPYSCYRLVACLDLAGIRWGTAVIPELAGGFDGNGLTISNLTITGGGYLGLFGRSVGLEIKNLGVVNVNIAGSGDYVGGLIGSCFAGSLTDCYSTGVVSGAGYVGGLVGYNTDGAVLQCHSSGAVDGISHVAGLVGGNGKLWFEGGSVTNCHSTSAVSGGDYVGGLLGDNFTGTVTGCYSTGAVSGEGSVGGLVGYTLGGAVLQCYSSGAVSGVSDVGGLVGYNYDRVVTGCYSAGSVKGTEHVGGLVGRNGSSRLSRAQIKCCYCTSTVGGGSSVGGLVGLNDLALVIDCYSTGSVVGDERVGGLVGWHTSSYDPTRHCFWDAQASNRATSSGGTGKTTAEMQTAQTFLDAGWDFLDEAADGTEDIWWILEGKDYPRLWWEAEEAAPE